MERYGLQANRINTTGARRRGHTSVTSWVTTRWCCPPDRLFLELRALVEVGLSGVTVAVVQPRVLLGAAEARGHVPGEQGRVMVWSGFP